MHVKVSKTFFKFKNMCYLCGPMRILLLTVIISLPLLSYAQFNTIGRVASHSNAKSEISTSTSNVKTATEHHTIEASNDREESPTITLHPPLKGKLHISSKFGTRRNPFGKKGSEHHSGLDLSAKAGTPIYAMLPGTIEAIGYDKRSGNFIKLRHGNFTVCYCHLIRKPKLPIGTIIAAGTPVAHVGSTGRSTGPHLHITVKHNGKIVNPEILFAYL